MYCDLSKYILVDFGEIVSSNWADLDHVGFGAKMVVRAQWIAWRENVPPVQIPESHHVDV